jgi:hypothetical protein
MNTRVLRAGMACDEVARGRGGHRTVWCGQSGSSRMPLAKPGDLPSTPPPPSFGRHRVNNNKLNVCCCLELGITYSLDSKRISLHSRGIPRGVSQAIGARYNKLATVGVYAVRGNERLHFYTRPSVHALQESLMP